MLALYIKDVAAWGEGVVGEEDTVTGKTQREANK